MNDPISILNCMDMLLGSMPTRKQIIQSSKFPSRRTLKIKMFRTMPFEFISSLLTAFMGTWGADFTIELSDYDTSLANLTVAKGTDIYVLWLDWRLYRNAMSAQDAADWVKDRILMLRKNTEAPILVNNWPEQHEIGEALFSPYAGKRQWVRELNHQLVHMIEPLPGCEMIDVNYLAQDSQQPFFDSRNDKVSHYPFSNQATISIARHLGVHLFPAVVSPRLKAIAIDLDDTLYSGVLGEDGVQGIRLTENHLLLQKVLLKLRQSGILLTLCSRNEENDVKALFNSRSDFVLGWNDFAAVCANWKPKPENMMILAKKLNMDPSAFLFLDDNTAELLKMEDTLPAVKLLRADPAGQETVTRLCHYPGLYQLHKDDTASIRTSDMKANHAREQLKSQAGDYNAYLASLQMVIRMYVNCTAHTQRLYELSQKTNQFNLALHRLNEVEAEQMMHNDDYFVVTAQLTDCLSDSGVIGAFVCRLEGDKADLIETLFSCRALGRDIETVVFAFVLESLTKRGVSRLSISTADGPRNAPAHEWLARYVKGDASLLVLQDLYPLVKALCLKHPAKVEEIL